MPTHRKHVLLHDMLNSCGQNWVENIFWQAPQSLFQKYRKSAENWCTSISSKFWGKSVNQNFYKCYEISTGCV